jgi:hypothetical protein
VSARQESVDVACLSEEKLNMVSIQSARRRIVALALHAQAKIQHFQSFFNPALVLAPQVAIQCSHWSGPSAKLNTGTSGKGLGEDLDKNGRRGAEGCSSDVQAGARLQDSGFGRLNVPNFDAVVNLGASVQKSCPEEPQRSPHFPA